MLYKSKHEMKPIKSSKKPGSRKKAMDWRAFLLKDGSSGMLTLRKM
jgi:hypothetical protein